MKREYRGIPRIMMSAIEYSLNHEYSQSRLCKSHASLKTEWKREGERKRKREIEKVLFRNFERLSLIGGNHQLRSISLSIYLIFGKKLESTSVSTFTFHFSSRKSRERKCLFRDGIDLKTIKWYRHHLKLTTLLWLKRFSNKHNSFSI